MKGLPPGFNPNTGDVPMCPMTCSGIKSPLVCSVLIDEDECPLVIQRLNEQPVDWCTCTNDTMCVLCLEEDLRENEMSWKALPFDHDPCGDCALMSDRCAYECILDKEADWGVDEYLTAETDVG